MTSSSSLRRSASDVVRDRRSRSSVVSWAASSPCHLASSATRGAAPVLSSTVVIPRLYANSCGVATIALRTAQGGMVGPREGGRPRPPCRSAHRGADRVPRPVHDRGERSDCHLCRDLAGGRGVRVGGGQLLGGEDVLAHRR